MNNLTSAEWWDLLRPHFPPAIASRAHNRPPGGYPSWKSVMTGVCESILSLSIHTQEGRAAPANTAVQGLLGLRHAQCDFPLIWADRSFLECVLRSDPPPDMPLCTLHWPFPAMAFLLPSGTLRHPRDGDCSWLLIGKAGGLHRCPLTGASIMGKDHVVAVMTAPVTMPDPPTYRNAITDDPAFLPFAGLPQQEAGGPVESRDPHRAGEVTGTDDVTFNDAVLSLGLRLILAMTARPELLAPAEAAKTVRSGGAGRAFLEPRWLGRGHRIPVSGETGGGAGASVRLHWRRGHFKAQPHGAGRSLRRIIRIEPCLAGGL